MIRVIKNDATLFERRQMPFVGVLVERQQHIRLVAGAEHLAGADADLEDGGTTRDRGGNGHKRHDFLLTAAGQPREKAADGLDAVLRVARDADHHFVDLRYFLRAARRRCTRCCYITHGTSNSKLTDSQGGLAAERNISATPLSPYRSSLTDIVSISNTNFIKLITNALRLSLPPARRLLSCC